jgi:hypothetical protein
MTLLSLLLITLWLSLLVLGNTYAGFVHVLAVVAVALVCVSGKRGSRRARAAAAAATVAATASQTGIPRQ